MTAGRDAVNRLDNNHKAMGSLRGSIDDLENLIDAMEPSRLKDKEPPEEPRDDSFGSTWCLLGKEISAAADKIKELTNRIRQIIYG